jgi:hypothetical protein
MKIIFVKPEHKEIIEEYLARDAVLILEKKMQDKLRALGVEDGEHDDDYDFGGEPDVALDIVRNENHCFFTKVLEDHDDEGVSDQNEGVSDQ